MLKAEAEDLLREASDCIGELLRRARGEQFIEHDGRCEYCGMARGDQHAPECRLWPLILWRQRYNDARAKDQPERIDMSTIWAKRL